MATKNKHNPLSQRDQLTVSGWLNGLGQKAIYEQKLTLLALTKEAERLTGRGIALAVMQHTLAVLALEPWVDPDAPQSGGTFVSQFHQYRQRVETLEKAVARLEEENRVLQDRLDLVKASLGEGRRWPNPEYPRPTLDADATREAG